MAPAVASLVSGLAFLTATTRLGSTRRTSWRCYPVVRRAVAETPIALDQPARFSATLNWPATSALA